MARKKSLTDQIASISPPMVKRPPRRGTGSNKPPSTGAGGTVDPNFNVAAKDAAGKFPNGGPHPQRPPNQSSTRVGSDRPKPKAKPYRLPGVQQNYASDTPRKNAKGEDFLTFTRPDKPGMTFHEYEDPKTGKRRVVGMKKKTGPPKGRQVPIGG
jgi:hypothetical protein